MAYIKVETSDAHRIWVNLNQISRATIGEDESGVETLTAIFTDGDAGNSLRIRGTDDINKQAITSIERALNHHIE